MLTGGQLNSLSTGCGAASPTAWDFEPNSWLNLEPIEGLESASEDDEAANRLAPPHPDSSAPATASASAMRRRPARPAPALRIISLLRFIRNSPRGPSLAKTGARAAGYNRQRAGTLR